MEAMESSPVVVARGKSEEALERVARVLQGGGIHFEVEERVGTNPDHPSWEWAVLVKGSELDRARRALAVETSVPHAPMPPAVPLFEPRGTEPIRLLLMLGAFGLGAWLWFLSCAS
jgi:hypothetical protein